MKKFLAALAIFAGLIYSAHADDSPVIVQNVFEAVKGQEGEIGPCKNYAVNVFAKLQGYDITVNQNSVWSTVDRDGHSYSLIIWCKNDSGLLIFTAAAPNGVEIDAVRSVFKEMKDGWQADSRSAAPAPPAAASRPFPEAPACFASSDDGVVNVRETPNGVLIGPIPSGTPLTVLGKYPTNIQWSRIQTPWLARVGRVGVVATSLITCN